MYELSDITTFEHAAKETGVETVFAHQDLIDRIRSTIVADDPGRICRVILYGSRATGTAKEDSDLDLLVVKQGPVSKRIEGNRLRKVLRGFPYSIDLRVMSEQEFEETRNIVGGVAYPASKYGIELV